MPPALTCAICGDAIGVYEPLVILDDESSRETSVAREPELDSARSVIVHRSCAAESAAAA